MDNQSKPRLEYPAGATDKWVSYVADKAVDRINKVIRAGEFYDFYRKKDIKFSDKDQALINSRGFLKRSVRGFIVEFLRQTRDNISVNEWPETPELRKESKPGIFQAAATVDWLVKNKMDKDDAMSALKIIIVETAGEFYDAYWNIDTKNTPKSEVKKATKEIIERVEKAEALRAQKAGVHTLVTR